MGLAAYAKHPLMRMVGVDRTFYGPVDRATFQDPHQYSEGMRWVVVNGKVVLDDGTSTRQRPGRGLRGPGGVGE